MSAETLMHILVKDDPYHSGLLDLFDQGEFDLFNNTVPIQIEGLFSDFLKAGTVFYRFTNMQLLNKAVLRGKIQYIKNLGLDVYHEAMMYFRI